jgi:hypothetical protein
MKKSMALICTFILLAAAACSQKPLKKNNPTAVSPEKRFFETFEKDLFNTSKVISANELIKNLTHLQKMNSGGSHYYPLERDSLTKMIQSLSSFPYAECILINRSGTIIYTMFENMLLSKNAEIFPSSLAILFHHCKEDEPYILDVAAFPTLAGSARLYFGIPVKRGADIEGVLIAAIDAEDVAKIIELKDKAIDKAGTVRLTRAGVDILQQVQGFSAPDDADKPAVIRTEHEEKFLRQVSYRNILWFIAE